MRRMIRAVLGPLALVVVTTVAFLEATPAADQASAVPATSPAAATGKAMTAAECAAERLGATIASSAIGEPVRNVTLSAPSWVEPANGIAALSRQRINRAGGHPRHGEADQLQRGAARDVEWPRRTTGRRRHERFRA